MSGRLLLLAATIDGLRSEIAAIKAQPAWVTRAESRLERQLRRFFADLGKRAKASPRRAASVVAAAERDYLEIVERATETTARAARRTAEATVGDLPERATKAVDPQDEPIAERRLRFADSTWERVVGDVRSVIDQAELEGIGIDEAAGRLGSVFDGLEGWEARRIARTEINGIAGDATFDTLLGLGVEFQEWVTTLDGHERDSHHNLNGEIVRVGELFSNGLRYPHDWQGSAEEVVNCRCRAAPWIPPEGFVPPSSGPFRAPGALRLL